MKAKIGRIVISMSVIAAGLLPAFAVPTESEISKVSPLVDSLMRGEVARMKNGELKASGVAEAAVALAKEADTEAAKYLLLTRAISYFARDNAYDQIEATIEALKESVPDISVREIVKMVRPIVADAPKTDVRADRLRKIVADYRAKEKSEALAEKMRQEIAKHPADRSLHTKLAEYMAVLGNWPVALTEFAQGDHPDAANAARSEQAVGGIAKIGEVADFWWNYGNTRNKTVGLAMRQHAAELYRSGIADGKITGLAKVQAERRIAKIGERPAGAAKDAENEALDAAEFVQTLSSSSVRECLLGPGVVMNFLACAGGSFTMGWPEADLKAVPQIENVFRPSEVKFTKSFWMSETLVSERQWAELMGEKSESDNPKAVTFAEAEKFLEKFRAKVASKIPSGCVVRLPTYAEYEYALKAGGAEKGTVFALLQPGSDAEAIRQTVDAGVSSARSNQWGLRGLRMKGGYVWLADRLGFAKNEMSPTAYRWDASGMRITRIDWPKTSVEPLMPLGDGSNFPVFLCDKGFFQLYGGNEKTKAFIRLVFAPKSKGGKK